MIAASVEGSVVTLLIMVVFALINWAASKLKSSTEMRPKQSGSRPEQPPEANSEEERMRKFMEALGLPAGSAPPLRRRETPPPLRQPAPTRRAGVPPIPPFVSGPSPERRRPTPSPAPPPVPRKKSADEQPAPHLRVEEIALAPLVTPTVPEFATVSSTISAMPGEHLQPLELGRSIGPELSPLAVHVRKAFSSPLELRSAFVLREVLGPPRSLQT
jgi:hypothetical protein